MRLDIVLFAVVLLFPFLTLAQQLSTHGETAYVELVLVDVLVTNRDGKPVLDLTREDFTLFVDGSPQGIDQFSAPSATFQTEPDVSGPSRETGRPAQSTGPPRAPQTTYLSSTWKTITCFQWVDIAFSPN